MTQSQPETKYLKDYRKPDFAIESVNLSFEIEDPITTVTSTMVMKRTGDQAAPLQLDGDELKLISASIDGQAFTDYDLTEQHLTLKNVPNEFNLEIVTEICPEKNLTLSGLYKSTGNFCTQCEAEGFRRITFFLDRPDVLTTYTTKITADKSKYPVLLSNGNKTDSGDLDNGKHFATWHDPHKKPCYLFALVAADLACRKDQFTTMNGRKVDLEIYVFADDLDRTEHAMESLKESMTWDEKRFGREYDLDIYMIVAVPDFNMGAMENKGLNIFNTKYVLADKKTATDMDYQLVQAVIGHEYFHNWTGNRITCRDWFQLSLKEGLTVFRDQEFTSDMHSRPVKRIMDVRIIRSAQFAEDASPMAHPIRPESYIEMNNFYTVTVYNKGAEIIRMIHTIAGADGFAKGMDLYFERFDGQAVTCNDYVDAIADGSGADYTQFKRWYSQAGTTTLRIRDHYDADAKKYTLSLEQTCPATPGQDKKEPFHIPVRTALIGEDGNELNVALEGQSATEHLLHFKEAAQEFVFENVDSKPTPSLLRDFSAPVKIDFPYSEEQLTFLFANDQNAFNRWDAGQKLAMHHIMELVSELLAENEITADPEFIAALGQTLDNEKLDPALIAEAIMIPTENTVGEEMESVLVDELHEARELVLNEMSLQLRDQLLAKYKQFANDDYSLDGDAIARRRLKNVCLRLLMQNPTDEATELCQKQFEHADNMSDQIAAFDALANHPDADVRSQAIETFYQAWQDEPLVVCKWLTVIATSKYTSAGDIGDLMAHEAFDLKNPNKVYALLVAFSQNQASFHHREGAGYTLMADAVKKLNHINPQVASRVVRSLMNWRRFDDDRQALMQTALENILAEELCQDVYEIVSKSLN